jgi:hypothetical protein
MAFLQVTNNTVEQHSINNQQHIIVFSVTNAAAFASGDATHLEVDELGPYVYSQLEARANATFSDDHEQVL